MNHSYQKVLCQLLVTLPSQPLLNLTRYWSFSISYLGRYPAFSETTFTGTSVHIQGVECGFVNVPLHNIYLSADLVSGSVAVGNRPSLPFKGVHLLLGNDLAGDKVVVNPLLTNTSCEDQLPDPIKQEISDIYPSCAVTKAMANISGKKLSICWTMIL